jgi:hypothetical protein
MAIVIGGDRRAIVAADVDAAPARALEVLDRR